MALIQPLDGLRALEGKWLLSCRPGTLQRSGSVSRSGSCLRGLCGVSMCHTCVMFLRMEGSANFHPSFPLPHSPISRSPPLATTPTRCPRLWARDLIHRGCSAVHLARLPQGPAARSSVLPLLLCLCPGCAPPRPPGACSRRACCCPAGNPSRSLRHACPDICPSCWPWCRGGPCQTCRQWHGRCSGFSCGHGCGGAGSCCSGAGAGC